MAAPNANNPELMVVRISCHDMPELAALVVSFAIDETIESSMSLPRESGADVYL
jgi:hypothetical protein